MEKLKNINTLSLSSNKNNFGNSLNNGKYPIEKYNHLTSKNLLNQISFQTLANKKSGTPKNTSNNNFSNNLINTNIILETGRIYKNTKNDELFKKQNSRIFNPNLKDGIIFYYFLELKSNLKNQNFNFS